MSTVYIADHSEVIYDTLKTRIVEKEKPKVYKSYLKVEKNAPPKKVSGIMGPPSIEPPDPSKFLRKGSKENKVSPPKEKPVPFNRRCSKSEKSMSVPSHKILGDTAKCTEKKDFIQENINAVKNMKPREPEARIVDTRYGESKPFRFYEHKYIYRSSYGKSPNYILQRISEFKKEAQQKKDAEALKNITKCRYITRPEREALLKGLKLNWEQMQREFQLLPIITDTIPKINKKTKLENDLKELEKDIVLVESHPYIYIMDEN